MRFQWRWLPIVLVWLLASSGCGVSDFLQQMNAVGQQDDEELLSGADLPAGTPLPALSNLAAGLEALESYRAVLELEIDASGGASETISILQEINRANGDQHYRMASRGNPATEAMLEYFVLEGSFYLLTAQSGQSPVCSLMSAQQSQSSRQQQALTPEEMFGPIQPGRLVAPGEILNGVVTDRYTVNQQQMGLGTAEGENGDIWIAREGGYVVRFSGQADGTVSGMAGAGLSEGSSSWSYELQEINSLGQIRLPEECQSARRNAEAIPIHPSAEDRTSFGGVTTYNSAEPPAALAEFYETELAKGGWSVTETLRLETLIIYKASLDRINLEITIAQQNEGAGSKVMIQEQ